MSELKTNKGTCLHNFVGAGGQEYDTAIQYGKVVYASRKVGSYLYAAIIHAQTHLGIYLFTNKPINGKTQAIKEVARKIDALVDWDKYESWSIEERKEWGAKVRALCSPLS